MFLAAAALVVDAAVKGHGSSHDRGGDGGTTEFNPYNQPTYRGAAAGTLPPGSLPPGLPVSGSPRQGGNSAADQRNQVRRRNDKGGNEILARLGQDAGSSSSPHFPRSPNKKRGGTRGHRPSVSPPHQQQYSNGPGPYPERRPSQRKGSGAQARSMLTPSPPMSSPPPGLETKNVSPMPTSPATPESTPATSLAASSPTSTSRRKMDGLFE